MMMRWTILIAMGFCSVLSTQAQNLVPNPTFDHPEGQLHGWHYDYEWTGNSHYVGNASRISVVDQEAGRRNVLRIQQYGEAGSKIESVLLPFEEGMRYQARLRVKGGPYRIYFSGHRWRPGVRPHDKPTLPEMRPVYRGQSVAGRSSNWQSITVDIPGDHLSDLAQRHLRQVRFVTLFIWFQDTGYVDDVQIMRVDRGR